MCYSRVRIVGTDTQYSKELESDLVLTLRFSLYYAGCCLLVLDMKVSPTGNFAATLRQLCGNAAATWAELEAWLTAQQKQKQVNKGKQDRARQTRHKAKQQEQRQERHKNSSRLVWCFIIFMFYFLFLLFFIGSL